LAYKRLVQMLAGLRLPSFMQQDEILSKPHVGRLIRLELTEYHHPGKNQDRQRAK